MQVITPTRFSYVLAAVLSALLVCESVASAQTTSDLFLRDANIVDPAARRVRRGNLLIRDGVMVGMPRRPPLDFAGRTLDLDGKWVIPGLVDLHTHTFGNAVLTGPIDRPRTAAVAQRMLYAGVTAFLDLFEEENQLFNTRARQRAGEIGGADMFASLSCITAPGGHGTEYGVPARTVSSPEEARRAVEDLNLRQPDVIKIIYGRAGRVPAIDRATLFAAVDAARANGLKTVVHVEGWDLFRDAVEAGATAVTHVPPGTMPEDLASLMVARNVVSIPTLTAHSDFRYFVKDPEVLDNSMARALTTPAVIAAYRSADAVALVDGREPVFHENFAAILESVKTMADAGVIVLAGTDSGQPGTLHGYSIHRELVKLVEAGIDPWQALAAATSEAGVFLGHAYGVTPGSEANLVVLDASPIYDIRNTQRIAYVIHHGAIVDREALIASEAAGLR